MAVEKEKMTIGQSDLVVIIRTKRMLTWIAAAGQSGDETRGPTVVARALVVRQELEARYLDLGYVGTEKLFPMLVLELNDAHKLALSGNERVNVHGLGRSGQLAHELVVREDRVAFDLFVVVNGRSANGQPVGGTKVDGFGKVEAVVEASVVGARESDNKLAFVLIDAVDL